MLLELHIKNYVLIDELAFRPHSGFNTITGETGAGKSILLGALGLILGKRADKTVIQDENSKCIVEGHFDLSGLDLESFFNANDIDFEEVCIIRREILPSGRSRAFINDTPVGLPQLKQLGEQLVDIHSQHGNILLKQSSFLFDWLDALSGILHERLQFQEEYRKLMNTREHLQKLKDARRQSLNEREYWTFVYEELEQAELSEGEMAQLEEKLDFLANAEAIRDGAIRAYNVITGHDVNLLDQMNELIRSWPNAVKEHGKVADFIERMNNAVEDLSDLAHEMRTLSEQPDTSPEELNIVEERMALLHDLLRKHQLTEESELISLKLDLENKLQLVEDRQQEIGQLERQIVMMELSCRKKANVLSDSRKSARSKIAEKVNADLKELGLPHAEIKLELMQNEELNAFGLDQFRLLFSANKGSKAEEVQKVASGGEVSRLMLVMKSNLAKHKQLPSMIFDEIDTGVSGEVAMRMAEMMAELGEDLQVISITHLPQIASRGAAHFYVYKITQGESTQTEIRELNGDERVEEVAIMLSGENPSASARNNARELLSRKN